MQANQLLSTVVFVVGFVAFARPDVCLVANAALKFYNHSRAQNVYGTISRALAFNCYPLRRMWYAWAVVLVYMWYTFVLKWQIAHLPFDTESKVAIICR